MDIIEIIFNKINSASSIGIVTHVNPDGDAIGTALALWRVLSVYGKKCDCLCDGNLPKGYNNIPFADFFNKKTLDKYDLMISVDVATLSRCGCYAPLFCKTDSVSFDHHAGRENFSRCNLVEYRSSCAEIVYSFLEKKFSSYISKEVAELLYVALITDCGGYAYEYVDSNSLEVGAKLLKYGINNSDLFRKYLNERPISVVKLSAYAIQNAVYECGGHLAILVFTQEILNKFGCGIDQTSSVIGDILRADTIKVAIGLTECNTNSYKVSIRTKGNDISALAIAEEFGGGGHKNASGCRLNGELGIVIDKLVFAVSKNWE